MAVHTCTRCPLRFPNRAELADHMALDHHLPAQVLEQLTYPGAQQAAPLYRSLLDDDEVHTVLLIANQTLGSDAVARTVADLRVRHPALRVFVLVPATPSDHLDSAPGAGRPAAPALGLDARTDDAGLAHARWRLRTALDALAALGVVAHGRVADPNPLTAAARAVAEESVDEIVVSTLDQAMSRWLRLDLPAALQRRFGLPVTTLTPAGADA